GHTPANSRIAQRRAVLYQCLYPLQFEPIYQFRLFGGRRMSVLLSAALPGNDPTSESWRLSDGDAYFRDRAAASGRLIPDIITVPKSPIDRGQRCNSLE
ncbi:MAG: hypothetical protein WBF89_04540, partial [Steroidobacteraceae bacterium]